MECLLERHFFTNKIKKKLDLKTNKNFIFVVDISSKLEITLIVCTKERDRQKKIKFRLQRTITLQSQVVFLSIMSFHQIKQQQDHHNKNIFF